MYRLIGNKVMKRNHKEAGIRSVVSCHKCGQLPIDEVCVNLFSKRESRANCPHGPMVKWLRHRPFTAVSGVRVPLGLPKKEER